jgi:zinc finger FYVE domain-containing protein 26
LSSGFESREVDDISVDTGSSSIEMSDLRSQPDMWIGRAEPLESLLGADIIAIAYDITNR